jgi:hypothetical protein
LKPTDRVLDVASTLAERREAEGDPLAEAVQNPW